MAEAARWVTAVVLLTASILGGCARHGLEQQRAEVVAATCVGILERSAGERGISVRDADEREEAVAALTDEFIAAFERPEHPNAAGALRRLCRRSGFLGG